MWIFMWIPVPAVFRLFTDVTKMHIYARSCMFVRKLLFYTVCPAAGKPNTESFESNENVKSPKNCGEGRPVLAAKKAVPADTA